MERVKQGPEAFPVASIRDSPHTYMMLHAAPDSRRHDKAVREDSREEDCLAAEFPKEISASTPAVEVAVGG